MTQHVSAVTRPKSNSCLDHVYSTHGDFYNISDDSVPNIGIADHLPVVFRRKFIKLKQPDWINDRIINAIKTRDKELKKARKSNDPAVWAKYRRAECFVTNLIRKSKRIYFQECIEKSKGNPKGIWNALKSLTK